jgi:hypothetical protein
MKYLLLVLPLISFSSNNEEDILLDSGISNGAIEFLREHDAYDDIIDAFYSDKI